MGNQEALEVAMQELDKMEKSQDAPQEELDALTKALEIELGEDLSKAKKKDEAAKKEDEDEEQGQDQEDGEPESEDECEKSLDTNFDEELIKASEAYADLEKSVHEGIGSVYAEVGILKKSMASLINLNIKMSKVLAELAATASSTESISKSMGALPTLPNKAMIGTGSSIESEPMLKSHSEIQELLLKAVSEAKIDSRYLSIYGTYRDLNRIPTDVQKIIGL